MKTWQQEAPNNIKILAIITNCNFLLPISTWESGSHFYGLAAHTSKLTSVAQELYLSFLYTGHNHIAFVSSPRFGEVSLQFHSSFLAQKVLKSCRLVLLTFTPPTDHFIVLIGHAAGCRWSTSWSMKNMDRITEVNACMMKYELWCCNCHCIPCLGLLLACCHGRLYRPLVC